VKPLDIALCYESVLPNRGGAETYIGDLARRLAADGHAVHLYASRWDAASLPAATKYHLLPTPVGPRFLRPWRFAEACEQALKTGGHDVSVGFDKTYGQDVLYPQGGLHVAAKQHNLLKFKDPIVRFLAASGKFLDPAARSFTRLEQRQYLGRKRPTIVVNSRMVAGHFRKYYNMHPENLHVVHSAVDPKRFAAEDRAKCRAEERLRWAASEGEPIGLMIAMNYRLKGLAQLIRAVAEVPPEHNFRIAVVGHPKFHKYGKLACKLGVQDRFLFLGFRVDPKDCYFAADFLVHPTFYDPCSLVVLEALACGLPVITTKYNGASELLSVPSDGLVVNDPHDALELAAALAKMLNADYRRHAAAAALKTARQWTFDMHYAKMLEVFDDVREAKLLESQS